MKKYFMQGWQAGLIGKLSAPPEKECGCKPVIIRCGEGTVIVDGVELPVLGYWSRNVIAGYESPYVSGVLNYYHTSWNEHLRAAGLFDWELPEGDRPANPISREEFEAAGDENPFGVNTVVIAEPVWRVWWRKVPTSRLNLPPDSLASTAAKFDAATWKPLPNEAFDLPANRRDFEAVLDTILRIEMGWIVSRYTWTGTEWTANAATYLWCNEPPRFPLRMLRLDSKSLTRLSEGIIETEGYSVLDDEGNLVYLETWEMFPYGAYDVAIGQDYIYLAGLVTRTTMQPYSSYTRYEHRAHGKSGGHVADVYSVSGSVNERYTDIYFQTSNGTLNVINTVTGNVESSYPSVDLRGVDFSPAFVREDWTGATTLGGTNTVNGRYWVIGDCTTAEAPGNYDRRLTGPLQKFTAGDFGVSEKHYAEKLVDHFEEHVDENYGYGDPPEIDIDFSGTEDKIMETCPVVFSVVGKNDGVLANTLSSSGVEASVVQVEDMGWSFSQSWIGGVHGYVNRYSNTTAIRCKIVTTEETIGNYVVHATGEWLCRKQRKRTVRYATVEVRIFYDYSTHPDYHPAPTGILVSGTSSWPGAGTAGQEPPGSTVTHHRLFDPISGEDFAEFELANSSSGIIRGADRLYCLRNVNLYGDSVLHSGRWSPLAPGEGWLGSGKVCENGSDGAMIDATAIASGAIQSYPNRAGVVAEDVTYRRCYFAAIFEDCIVSIQ